MDKIILDIVPLTRIPLTRNQSFSYLYDRELPAGTLVSIPLFHRNVEGIVLGNRPDFPRLGNIHPVKYAEGVPASQVFNRVKLKKINKVLEENFLDEKQLELAKFISEYYISPLGIVMKGFVPKRTKARNTEHIARNIKKKEIKLTKEQQKAVEEITKSYKLPPKADQPRAEKTKSYLLFGPASSGKTEVYIHSILELKKKNPELQFLILLPELTLTPQAIERYGEYFKPEEIAVINSKISKGQFYANWQKIKSGEAKIIIGSRMAVFLPFKKLGLIVIDEEQDMSFKQWDMNPRYDARTVAEKLAEFHNCPIVIGSATPRIETYYQALNKKFKLLKLSKLKIPNTSYIIPDTKTEIIDMKKERWINPPAGGYSPISKKLQAEIAYALKNNLQTILFINRQGMSSFSICADCKTVLKCPRCDRALVYDEKGNYRCLHCSYQTSITPQCSKCHGIIFKNIGLGTQKVEREINELFPGAKTARIDTQALKEKNYQEKIYQEFKDKKIDILIGTQMISKGWDLPDLALVGIIDGDGMLSLPDFSAYERAFQHILQVAGRVSRPGAKFPGQVVIQTFNPEKNIFKKIAGREIEKFYQVELVERKSLKFPPYSKIIKLVFQDLFLKKVEKETERVYSALKKNKNISVSEPQNAFVPKIRGRFRRQIVLKSTAKNIPEETIRILKALPAGWIIDVDPISIL
ncbi:MAG: primosomal protein N' [Candidatus Moranbacteria bacterium]|nr:primosomal protein N' [Candidatus Moranbacteria bacterium]